MDELRILLRRYALGAWRRRWIAIAVSWAVCVAGWAVVSAIPNQYEASARLYVDSDAVLTPLLRGLALDNTPVSELDVLQRTLLSRPNLEKLISKTDLELGITGAAGLESLVGRLATDIRIVPQTRNLFTITYRNARPRLAYDVVQSILSIFVESKVGTNRTDMENARVFLQQQIAFYERQLREAETRLAEFRSKYIDLLPSDANGGASRLETARSQIEALQGQLVDLTNKREALRHELTTTPVMLDAESLSILRGGGGGNPEIQKAEAALAELRLRYTEQHPEVVNARKHLANLRANPPPAAAAEAAPESPRGRTSSIPNPAYLAIKTQLFDADIQFASLQRQLADATRERARLEEIARGEPGLQAEFTNLNRDYDVVHKNYTELLSRRESMRLAAAADTDAEKVKMQVIDPPLVPQLPVAPKRALLLSAVLLAGLGGGAGLIILLQQFDRSFHSIEDLRELGLPVAGGISLLGAAVPLRRLLISAAGVAVALLLLGAVYGGLLYRLQQTPGVA
jgi:polysaccharide chain length determinant protein (PEP-CTERM system associated)